MPQKLNSAGKMQNYVPKGNGDASGEYGDSATGSNIHYTKDKVKVNVIDKETVVSTKANKDKRFNEWYNNIKEKNVYQGDIYYANGKLYTNGNILLRTKEGKDPIHLGKGIPINPNIIPIYLPDDKMEEINNFAKKKNESQSSFEKRKQDFVKEQYNPYKKQLMEEYKKIRGTSFKTEENGDHTFLEFTKQIDTKRAISPRQAGVIYRAIKEKKLKTPSKDFVAEMYNYTKYWDTGGQDISAFKLFGQEKMYEIMDVFASIMNNDYAEAQNKLDKFFK